MCIHRGLRPGRMAPRKSLRSRSSRRLKYTSVRYSTTAAGTHPEHPRYGVQMMAEPRTTKATYPKCFAPSNGTMKASVVASQRLVAAAITAPPRDQVPRPAHQQVKAVFQPFQLRS